MLTPLWQTSLLPDLCAALVLPVVQRCSGWTSGRHRCWWCCNGVTAAAAAAVDGTTKRLVISDGLTNLFRSLMLLSPQDVTAAAYLACGELLELDLTCWRDVTSSQLIMCKQQCSQLLSNARLLTTVGTRTSRRAVQPHEDGTRPPWPWCLGVCGVANTWCCSLGGGWQLWMTDGVLTVPLMRFGYPVSCTRWVRVLCFGKGRGCECRSSCCCWLMMCAAAGKIAPDYAGMDLNVGGSLVAAAVGEVTGVSRQRMRELYSSYGDLGDVAQVGGCCCCCCAAGTENRELSGRLCGDLSEGAFL